MQVMPRMGCNTFQISAADGTIVTGRAMDYPINMQSQILAVNRGQSCTTTAPDGQPGHQWVSSLGFLGINAFGLNCIDDGLNEKGLSYAILTLPETVYSSIEPNEDSIAIPISRLGEWILGNFGSVSEVEAALKTVKIWGDTIPQINQVPKVHVALNDNAQNNLVIEFIKGKTKVYKNPVGVLTNEPRFKYHLHELKFYNQLSASPASNTSINGHPIESFVETGLDGTPGGYSARSRFVRIATHIRLMTKPQTAIDAVIAASRILNTVDIIPGMVNLPFNNDVCSLSTQWSTIKDLTHKVLYYRITDGAIKSIDLTQTNFSSGAPHNPIGMSEAPTIIPMKI